MKEFGFDGYLSPFTWRYASPEMRAVFSEENTRLLWRRVWVALARAQNKAGLVSKKELADIEAHATRIDIARSLEIERETGHDVMAEVKAFAEQCKVGGGKIHLGATSMDVVDNADALKTKQALALVKKKLAALLLALKKKIDANAGVPCIGYTHLQPAEPTTLGYRFAFYAQELLQDFDKADYFEESLQAKGFKGAVGSSASYAKLLEGTRMKPSELEEHAMKELGLEAFEVTSQTAPRKQDLIVLNALAGIGESLHKMCFDFRLLQSPEFGEVSEPFGEKQVGSSAMPFKRNPVSCEKICSLARFVSALPAVAWSNAALSALERTLDDSANKRIIFPEAFLAVDEMLDTALRVVEGLQINREAVARNLDKYAPFAGTEALMMELVKKGANRQQAHELIREHSMRAWEVVKRGEPNPLKKMLASDLRVTKLVPPREVEKLLDARNYVGDAEQRARDFSKKLAKELR